MYIDVFHDTVCPWCRVGKANLDAALAAWAGPPPHVRFRPYMLAPGAPPEGRDFRAQLASRYGGAEALARLFDGPRRAGSALGVRFEFERIARAPNTLLSHVLVGLAPEGGAQGRVLDALHTAYFEEGRDIGEPETLAQLGAAAGLDEAAVHRGLADGDALHRTREAAADARDGGITGVPLFVFNERRALAGAHPPDALLQAMRDAMAPA
jgi:predicted DsbA family dithiol-disulfide isomerase